MHRVYEAPGKRYENAALMLELPDKSRDKLLQLADTVTNGNPIGRVIRFENHSADAKAPCEPL
jgi:hypothetical protein